VGTVWSAHKPDGTWGYDGQFYYQIARNPPGAAQYMDNAPYRYQHFLYALLAWMLSFGQAALVPYVLLFINFVAIIGSVELSSRLLSRYGFSPWFSLALGLYYGQAIGLIFDTTEPFTYFLVSLGLWYLDRKQMLVSAIWMGLATLSRETAMLFPLCFALSFAWKRQWKWSAAYSILSIIPLIFFLLLLALIFGHTGVTFTPPFEHIPFAGIFYYQHTPHKFWLLVLMMLIPLLGSLAFLGWDLLHLRFNEATLIWATNLGLIVFMSHFSYIELISCGRVSIASVLAGLFYAGKTRNKNLLWTLQLYILTFAIYFVGTLIHLDSFIAV
jgi:Gpi18-like mannosyltransferase